MITHSPKTSTSFTVFKAAVFCFLLLFVYSNRLSAQNNFVFDPSASPVTLQSHFKVLEDVNNQLTFSEVLNNQAYFKPIQGFKFKNPASAFWLIARVSSAVQAEASIYFDHLSYADLYFVADTPGAQMIHQQAGAFRSAKHIANGDSRFSFSIKLDQNTPYIVLIKSRHVKKYQPIFQFYLSERFKFLENKFSSEIHDLWPQGASALLFLYIFLRWITTRHRPFIWLMLFVAAFNLYGIALNRYLIDWFFPTVPHLGWLLPQHLLHLGLLGLYLLLLDSWDIEHKDVRLYQWGKTLLYGLILLTSTIFILNYHYSNFELAGKITIGFLFVLLFYSITLLISIWKKLSKQELYLAYGLILFFGVIIIGSLGVLIFEEMAYVIIPNLAKAISICIAFLFLMGLNGRLRQKEIDYAENLNELNLLQKEQNEILEESVAQRTEELSQRNILIETLINEVHHRVKNNLQMLYSLNSVRIVGNESTAAGNILRDNISRIKAMMLVNECLQPNDEGKSQNLQPFINNIVTHSSKIFELEKTADLKISIEPEFTLESKLVLPLGLIISELLVNAYKHAFKETHSPKISIIIARVNNCWQINFSDNGSGMQANSKASFGTNLIEDLARQMKAKLNIISELGLSYTLTIPIENADTDY